MKFCKDCRHCKPSEFRGVKNFRAAVCLKAPKNPDPVTGEEQGHFSCDVERQFECGPEAKQFEPIDEAAKNG